MDFTLSLEVSAPFVNFSDDERAFFLRKIFTEIPFPKVALVRSFASYNPVSAIALKDEAHIESELREAISENYYILPLFEAVLGFHLTHYFFER